MHYINYETGHIRNIKYLSEKLISKLDYVNHHYSYMALFRK